MISEIHYQLKPFERPDFNHHMSKDLYIPGLLQGIILMRDMNSLGADDLHSNFNHSYIYGVTSKHRSILFPDILEFLVNQVYILPFYWPFVGLKA